MSVGCHCLAQMAASDPQHNKQCKVFLPLLAAEPQQVHFSGLRPGGSRAPPGHLVEVLPQLLSKLLTASPLQDPLMQGGEACS